MGRFCSSMSDASRNFTFGLTVFLLEEKPLGDMGCISEATWPPPAAAAMGDPMDGDTERRAAGSPTPLPPPPPPGYLFHDNFEIRFLFLPFKSLRVFFCLPSARKRRNRDGRRRRVRIDAKLVQLLHVLPLGHLRHGDKNIVHHKSNTL